MPKVAIKVLVEAGKATPAPPLGPSLAAHKVNIGQVIAAINEATKEFTGMQVPVEITLDTETKEFEIKVGLPPISSLIKRELGLAKLAKTPWRLPAPKEGEAPPEPFEASLSFDQVLKIAKAKMADLGTTNLKAAVKQVVGSCISCGVQVEGKSPKEIIKEIDAGKFDAKLRKQE
jgi:large subunit ribosomal protein L11